MKILLSLVLLLALALVAGPLSHGRFSRFSRSFFLVGAEFLLIGIALRHLGILNAEILSSISPLLTLGLGWIGLLIGLQFEFSLLRKIPASFHAVAFLQGLLVMMALSAVFYFPLARYLGAGIDTMAAALLIGAAGAGSSQDTLAMAIHERKRHPHAPLHLFRYSAALDSVIPVITLVLLFGIHHGMSISQEGSSGWKDAILWIAYATAIGAILGLLFELLIHRVRERSHHLLLVIGFLIFSGGLAMALDFPPLYVNFIAGLVVVNIRGHHPQTWEIASASEKPFYFMFLVLVGASWHLGNPWALLLAPLYFILRVIFKALSFWVAGRLVFGKALLDMKSGLALSGQGAVAVAVAASIQMVEKGTLADSALTIILSGVLLSALFAPGLTLMGLQRGGKQ